MLLLIATKIEINSIILHKKQKKSSIEDFFQWMTKKACHTIDTYIKTIVGISLKLKIPTIIVQFVNTIETLSPLLPHSA